MNDTIMKFQKVLKAAFGNKEHTKITKLGVQVSLRPHNTRISKALTAPVVRLSLSVGWENGTGT